MRGTQNNSSDIIHIKDMIYNYTKQDCTNAQQPNKQTTIWIYAKPRYTEGHNRTQLNSNKQIRSAKGHIDWIYRFRKSL